MVVHLLLWLLPFSSHVLPLKSSHVSPQLGLRVYALPFQNEQIHYRTLPTVRIFQFLEASHTSLCGEMFLPALVTSLTVDVSSSFVLLLVSKFLRPPILNSDYLTFSALPVTVRHPFFLLNCSVLLWWSSQPVPHSLPQGPEKLCK